MNPSTTVGVLAALSLAGSALKAVTTDGLHRHLGIAAVLAWSPADAAERILKGEK